MLKNYTTSHKYFLYARKSTESEDKQMASIEDQITEMKRLAEKRGFHIVDIIKETKSAKEPGRPKFNEMLSRIHKGEANAILTWKLNRLARNPIDGGQISWMLQQHKIQEIATYASSYLPSDNVLLMQIEFGMATQYVKDLSVSVSRGMRRKAERGWYPASSLPSGYMRNPNKKEILTNDIIADPTRFKKVKKLWKLALSGNYNISELTKIALEIGLKSKTGKEYGRNFLYDLFKNEFYCGHFYWKNEHGEKTKYKGRHIPMVSIQEFNQVQTILYDEMKYQKGQGTFLFRGFVKCGECSRNITSQRKLQCICTNCKRKFSSKLSQECPICETEIANMKNPSRVDQTYYYCCNSKDKCSQKPINEKTLEKQLKALLSCISISKDFYNYALKHIDQLELSSKQNTQNTIENYQKVLTGIEKKIKQLNNLRLNEELSAHEFAELKAELNDDKEKYSSLIINAISENQQEKKAFKKYLDASVSILESYEKGDFLTKRKIIKLLSGNLKLLNKNLYFSIPKALFKVLLYSELYNSNSKGWEPKKSLIFPNDLAVFSFPSRWGGPEGKILEPKFNRLVKEFEKLCA